MAENIKKIIVASGGTGGHIFPAVSLANYLEKIGFELILTSDIRGSKFIDSTIIKNIKIINTSTFNKRKKGISIIKILFAIFKSFIFLLKEKPKMILGMGGYASFPVCFAGIILRIPIIIYENNLLIGKANKFLIPFTKKIFVSYKDIEGIDNKYKNKITIVGNILREQILNWGENNDSEIKKNINILILGGSQAAKVFAEILPNIFIDCKNEKINFKIYQQCLSEQKEELQKFYQTNNINCELFSFTFDIFKYYKLSDLVITRAGSSALAEFLNCKIPIISIPLPSSSENHQLKNAQYFMEKGYSFMIEEKDIKVKLFNLLQSIDKDRSMLTLIKKNQKKYSDKDVFLKIKKKITELIYEN